MALKDNFTLLICLLFTLGGTLFVLISWRGWSSTGRIIKTGVQTQGVVVELARRPRKPGETLTPNSVAPVVLFVTEKGEQRRYYSSLYTAIPSFAVGQAVDLWYLPDEPEKATLQGGDAWILPVAFGIFGAAMCLIGYPWLFGIIRQYLRS
ncbi:MAG: DUF3592 domain-containing protein [Saprospiraceae bacterium]|nr:DUF3592 domain-containing protein [Saprospiraceae bacterium]MCB0675737.1 DUF3592 domain-containing protein [Saprospiraceae bacterium]